jgi:hypothetical protein
MNREIKHNKKDTVYVLKFCRIEEPMFVYSGYYVTLNLWHEGHMIRSSILNHFSWKFAYSLLAFYMYLVFTQKIGDTLPGLI